MKKHLFTTLLMALLTIVAVGVTGCGSEEDTTIDYYGKSISYTPIEEINWPEWLRELKGEKNMLGLYRICVGVHDHDVIYHLSRSTDSNFCGLFYDQDGNLIDMLDCTDFIKRMHHVKCIYYKNYDSDTPIE